MGSARGHPSTNTHVIALRYSVDGATGFMSKAHFPDTGQAACLQ